MTSSLKTFWRHKNSSYSSISLSNKSEKNMTYLGIKMEKMRTEKSGKHSKLRTKKWKVLNGRRYKEFLSSQARNAYLPDLMLGRRGTLCKGSGYVTDGNCSNQVDLRDVHSSSSCSKRQRLDLDSEQGCISYDLRGVSRPVNESELDAGLENMDENAHGMDCTNSQPDTQIESQYTECTICLRGGKLLCCDGQGCSRSFHLSCVDPPLTCFPPGVWYCIWCIKEAIHYGVHCVSEGIESILDSREVVSDDVVQSQKQYLVKYKGLAHVHSRWIPESQMLHEAPTLLAKFKKNTKTMKWKRDWSVPHRLMQKRLLLFPEPKHFQGHNANYSDCRYVWLVKWTGLGYNDATWELENASFLKTPEAMNLMTDYERRHQKPKIALAPLSKEIEGRKLTCPELSEFSFGRSHGEPNCHLSYVNKLRGYLYRGQNACVIDDKERVVKVVLFMLSLLDDDTRKPFLIITPSNALSLWEAEFSHWASSANIVVYNGNKDVRASIRTLEFYNEGGSMMFQILLSPPHVVDEDLDILEHVKWEAVIIDECQRRQISVHLKQIKKLSADMRLLLVSCQVKDRRFNYQDVLSLLDPKFDGTCDESLEADPSLDISKLKERLAQFVAFECRSGTSEFSEYWVPVHLSDVQVEQYCAQLLSNSMMLCSCLKNDSVDSLRDLILFNRKCCDHPYLGDRSLQSSTTSGLHVVDHFDVEINVSGKLQLLEKILSEIKTRGLRVLLLFQSLGGSGPISIGDILDDFIRNRFGEDSYARMDGEIVRSKKKAALNLFNNKESGNFVCLIDNRACLPDIKLSSVDIVVIFDSDWNPINDLRALQKITINSQYEPLKVFRLYSPCTVEEKALILAKQGATLDSNIQNINWSTCHKLLKWGAYRLFSRLDDSHAYKNTLLNDVFGELSDLMPNNCENGDPSNCSIISSVKENEGAYPRNISLLGENEAQSMDTCQVRELLNNEPSPIFWTNLLEGRPLMERHLCGPSQRSRRKAKRFDGLLANPEFEGDCRENKRPKTLNLGLVSPPRRPRNRRKARPRIEEREPAEVMQHTGAATSIIGEKLSEASSPTVQSQILHGLRISTDISPDFGSNEPVQSPPVTTEIPQSACLDPLMESVQKGKEEAINNHEERKRKLISECDREIAEVRKRYDQLLQEAELAFMEEKKDLETFYNKVYANKLLAEAMAQKQEDSLEGMQQDAISRFMDEIIQQYFQQVAMNEQLMATLQMTGTPVQVVNHHPSSAQPTDANTLRTKPSSSILPMAGSPSATPPLPVMTHSYAPPEPMLVRSSATWQTGAGYVPILERSSPSFPSTSAPVTHPLQLVSPSSLQPLRPLTIPTIHGSGRPLVVNSVRAPAPHLRRTRPPSASPQTNQPLNLS